MRLSKISNKIYADTEGKTGGNVGIILTENYLIAVDAQYPASGRIFRKTAEEITGKKVTHLILTHYHSDHIFGAQAFEDCKIMAHKTLREMVEENLKTIWSRQELKKMIERIRRERPERAWLYEGLKIVLPNQTFEEKYVIENVEIIHMGGHTEDSSIVYVPKDKVMFAGDLVFSKMFPWGGDRTANPDKWIEAFRRMLEMDVEKIVPGHGPICNKEEIKIQLKYFEEVRKKMKELIEKNVPLEKAIEEIYTIPFYKPMRKEMKRRTLEQWYKFWLKNK